MFELDKIKELIKEWPKDLDAARRIEGINCISWHTFTMEPITIRLIGGEREFHKADLFS